MRRLSLSRGGSVAPLLLAALLAGPAAAEAQRAEGAFQRTLTVTAPPEIEVVTGSGRIEVTPGGDGRIEVTARIQASDGWGSRGALSPEERVRRIEANPPIEQSGSVVRIGHIEDEDVRRGVSVSYALIVPAGSTLKSRTGSGSQTIRGVTGAVEAQTGSGSLTLTALGGSLRASTGSGSIAADGVGGALHATTGSGAIRATGVTGAITARTGSGRIEVEQTGGGEVQAASGSGSIRLRGIKGSVRASSGSGGLAIQGALAGEWRLSTASGSVSVSLPEGQGFELDAGSSSGRIDLGMPVTVSGSVGRRALRGSVHGGGPLLHVRTASGGIRIQTEGI